MTTDTSMSIDTSSARVEEVTAAAYRIPTDADNLGQVETDGTATWEATTLVVVHVRTGRTVGTGWTYAPAACAELVEEVLRDVVVGRDVDAISATWAAMVAAVRNVTRAGVAGYGISAVDVALWDLKARRLGVAVADLLGRARDHVEVYGSGGFTSYDDDELTTQLDGWVHGLAIPRVKIKIGRPGGVDHDRDVHRMLLARQSIGPGAELFVDANGAYTAKQAIRALDEAQADGAQVTWFEEPVSSDDLPGLALVRARVDADVAAGEYGTDIGYFQTMCAAGAVDCLQVDATRAGGYTEWVRAAAVAAAHHLDVSAHCAPNLHAHVAATTMNARHIEWFHDHARIEAALFHGALDPTDGTVTPDPTKPGHGMTLNNEAAAPYRVRAVPAGAS
jgi:L-alanine-DL-glutamate epimerase-like enolase superfamily enzyme